MPPVLLEQLDVPTSDPSICPWGIASIPICAKPEDTDDSKDILPGMGFISDFFDIVHWNRCTSALYPASAVRYIILSLPEIRHQSAYIC